MDAKGMLALFAVLAVVGACGDQPKRAPAEPMSRATSKISATDLRKAADNARADRADRADRVAAVFALFANHLRAEKRWQDPIRVSKGR
jgi:hypothetical protein